MKSNSTRDAKSEDEISGSRTFRDEAAMFIQCVRYDLRCFLGRHPSLYLPLNRLRYASRPHTSVIDRDTEILIDGFPRSGNSFAWAAFCVAQRRPVRVAHHVHAPAQFLYAAKHGIPAILLIRKPEDAILSWHITKRGIPIPKLLQEYIGFYGALWPHRDHIVVAKFDTVITNFGRIIVEVNARFGTEFEEFTHGEEDLESCLRMIEGRWTRSTGRTRELRIGRPSEVRDELKQSLRARLRSGAHESMWMEAQAVHESFLGHGRPPPGHAAS